MDSVSFVKKKKKKKDFLTFVCTRIPEIVTLNLFHVKLEEFLYVISNYIN